MKNPTFYALFGLLALICNASGAEIQATRPPTDDPTYGIEPGVRPAPARRSTDEDAKWIWGGDPKQKQPYFFRRSFKLDQVPAHARLYGYADGTYKLYVNGKRVFKDYSDADGEAQHISHADVAGLLVPGENSIALKVTDPADKPGVLVRLEGERGLLLRSDETWTFSRDKKAWQPVSVVGPLYTLPWTNDRFGLVGWPNYLPEGPSYLSHLELPAMKIVDKHDGEGRVEGETSLLSLDHPRLKVTHAPIGSKNPPFVILDAGRELTGRVLVQAAEFGVMLVSEGESLEEATVSPLNGLERVVTEAGGASGSYFSAGRFFKLVFPNEAGLPAQQSYESIRFDHLYYPVSYQGTFDCSDRELTRIWYMGAFTAHNCMQNDVWDGAKRDRMRWAGDLHVAGEVIDTAFADRMLMEQTFKKLREESEKGLKQGEPPRNMNGIPSYSCAWISALADFHRHIGDLDFLREQKDFISGLIERLKRGIDPKTGLFTNADHQWDFVDWSADLGSENGNKDSVNAQRATHFFMIKGAREAAFIFRELGEDARAQETDQWAEALTAAAQRGLIDSKKGTVGPRRQSNAMAVLSGATTVDENESIWNKVLNLNSRAWRPAGTPYYTYYVLQAISQLGHVDEALQLLRRYWGGMVKEKNSTTFWEAYDPSWPTGDHFHSSLMADDRRGTFISLNHAWSAGPTAWLTETILGVRPTAGGYREVEIRPNLGDLTWASGDTPTPRGPIRVRVERAGERLHLKLVLPPGTRAHVSLPGMEETTLDRAGDYDLGA